MSRTKSRIPDMLSRHESELLDAWVRQQLSNGARRSDLMNESQLREQCAEFLRLLRHAVEKSGLTMAEKDWEGVRGFLHEISSSRARQGFSATETATFIFSFKEPLFERLRQEYGKDSEGLAGDILNGSLLIDQLGLMTTESYQKAREDVIARQQRELLELSTPVVRLWEGVLALPLIGTLDSERTQIVMQSLLQKVVETGSAIAIIDITGVPLVDTLVAQHLLKTVAAARLMGADCIISGIRPQIAQTIVHLGVELRDVTTKATLSDALMVALKRTGYAIRKASATEAPAQNGTDKPSSPSAVRATD